MAHSKEDIEEWVQEQYANDYYRFEHIQADFKVLSFESNETSLDVIYSFVADESRLGNESDDLVLFHYDEDNWQGFFPNQLQIVTIGTKYIWQTAAGCANLDEDFEEQDESDAVEWVTWDDNKLSDSTIARILGNYDKEAIAETLVKMYSASTVMPDFIPNRLKDHVQLFINDYLKDKR